jgi:regulation of enolase protein 1 (concanavalin A-like superfamily)
MTVYPNPVHTGGTITIEGTVKGAYIQVYNQLGVRVKTAIANNHTITLTMDVTPGTYVIRAGDKKIKVVVK